MKIEMDEKVSAVRERIKQWRRKRMKSSPMPETLWTAAVALAETHGVYPVAQTLCIDFGALRRRLELSTREPADAAPHGFVELKPPSISTTPAGMETAVELNAADGAKMTFRFSGNVGLDLAALATAFWAEQNRNRTR